MRARKENQPIAALIEGLFVAQHRGLEPSEIFDTSRKTRVMAPTQKKWLLWIGIFLIWAIAAAFAVFASEAVLSENRALDTFVRFVLPVIDPASSLGEKSKFPQVTVLYYSIAWFSTPFWLKLFYAWFSRQISKSADGLLFKEKLSIGSRILLVVLVPIWIALLVGFVGNHGGDVRLAHLGTSRGQLALFGMAFPMGFSALICLIIFSLKRAFQSNR